MYGALLCCKAFMTQPTGISIRSGSIQLVVVECLLLPSPHHRRFSGNTASRSIEAFFFSSFLLASLQFFPHVGGGEEEAGEEEALLVGWKESLLINFFS